VQSLVPSPEFAEHRGESRGVAPERGEEFLISALDEMDQLASEAATGRGRAQRVGARVGRVIGATHELLSLERPEHLRGRHRVGVGVAREHDLCHGLVLLGERRHAREEHHLEVGETGVAKRAALTALPAIHGLPEENARARGGRGELRRESFRHRRGRENSKQRTYHKYTYYHLDAQFRQKDIARQNHRSYHSPSRHDVASLLPDQRVAMTHELSERRPAPPPHDRQPTTVSVSRSTQLS
jgi:hypothetical protein